VGMPLNKQGGGTPVPPHPAVDLTISIREPE